MAVSYDEAVVALYQAPHDAFVAERQRLVTELRTSGDKAGAARLAKLGRPQISAWVVNQLFWQAREAFDELLVAARRVREGDLDATGAHRAALTNLRTRAAVMLENAGHSSSETTLRRVTSTLSALAAAGGFDPDPPGALVADREAPGFEAAGIAETLTSRPPAKRRESPVANKEAEQVAQRAEEAAERQRMAEESARQQAERTRLQGAVRAAQGELDDRTRQLQRLRAEVAAAAEKVEKARARLAELEMRLAAFE